MATDTVLVRDNQAAEASCDTTRKASCQSVDLFKFNEEYVERLRGNDAATWEHFDSYFRSRIRAKLRAQLPWHMVDDLIGDVMVAVVENLKRGKPENANCLAGYVLQICQYKVLEAIRKLASEKTFADVDCDLFPADGKSPQQQALAAEQREEIANVLRQLRRRDHDLLLAVFYRKMDRDEACKKYKVTREGLKLILYRARKRFQKKWKRP